MAYKVSWLVEGRVILAELSGELTPDELRAYDRTVCKHLDSAAAPQAHYLVDTSRLECVPGLNHSREFAFLAHPRLGWTAAVGTFDPLVRLVANFMSRLYKVRTHELKSVAEALDFLQQLDSTLPDLHAALKETHRGSQLLPIAMPQQVVPAWRRPARSAYVSVPPKKA